MLFNSIHFIIFFPFVMLIYFLIPPKIKNVWLLAASYYFYMSWNPKYIFLLLTSTVITYVCGIIIDKIEKNEWGLLFISQAQETEQRKAGYKKCCIFIGLFLNIGILFFFKYFHFFIDTMNALLEKMNIHVVEIKFDVLLPVGISFYTFQALGYLIDVYRKDVKAERNFLEYALFVSFFPQLVAGPIERSHNLLHQLKEKHSFSSVALRDGLMLMLWGFFLKLVIADRAAVVVNTVFGDMKQYGGFYLIIAGILFAFQIYGDFAGYSTIAMGAAKIMGIQLTDNFNAPYFSQSVAEFWRRWHISLSGWFRDYLYIPLGGSRKGKHRKYRNLLLVFLVSGLWHGANITYILWGGANGLYQILGSVSKRLRDDAVKLLHINRQNFSHKLLSCILTFVLIDLAWILFRASNISEAIFAWNSILHADNSWILWDGSLYLLGLGRKSYQLLCLAIVVLMLADWFKNKGVCIREFIYKQDLWFRWLVYIGSVIAVIVFGIYGYGYDANNFIYFQF